MIVGEAIQKQTQGKDNQRALDDFQEEVATRAANFNAARKCQWDSDSNYKKEKRKDQISRGPAAPLCMVQRPIDVAPRSRIVHQHHAGDRDAAKHVERDETGI